MLSLNCVCIAGTLAGQPVASTNDRGTAMTTASLLLIDRGANDIEYKTFAPLVAYGRAGERLAMLEDGALCAVTGTLGWQKGRNGAPGRVEVVVQTIDASDERQKTFTVSSHSIATQR